MEYGNLNMRINEILEEKGISKNKICKGPDILRTNFNKYYHDNITRFDTGVICKLCW
ncbi:XRE family transcriptional regulator [Lachnospiraceae bacterium]|nr:XRE family transcriptional regulator [Lachnospiraceae bacterium]